MLRHITDYAPTMLSAKELDTLGVRLVNFIGERLAADSYLAAELMQVKTGLLTVASSSRADRRNPQSKVLKQMHATRRRGFVAFWGMLAAMAKLEMRPEQSALAAAVLAVMMTVARNAHKQGYVKGTATLRNLLRELKTEQVQADLATLGMKDVFDFLEKSHTEFEAAYKQKVEQDGSGTQTLTMAARNDVIFHLTNCIQYIDSLAERDPSTYGEIAKELTIMIQDVTTIARARHTRMEHEAEAEPPLPVTPSESQK